jgi:hypothetical protein
MRFALLVGWIGCAAALFGADDVAKPKAISGTFTAAFEGFSEFGQPQVRLKLQLASSLSCPPSAPKLTFSVKGGVDAYFVSAPKESAAYISTGFAYGVEKDGLSEAVNTDFPAGSYSYIHHLPMRPSLRRGRLYRPAHRPARHSALGQPDAARESRPGG